MSLYLYSKNNVERRKSPMRKLIAHARNEWEQLNQRTHKRKVELHGRRFPFLKQSSRMAIILIEVEIIVQRVEDGTVIKRGWKSCSGEVVSVKSQPSSWKSKAAKVISMAGNNRGNADLDPVLESNKRHGKNRDRACVFIDRRTRANFPSENLLFSDVFFPCEIISRKSMAKHIS